MNTAGMTTTALTSVSWKDAPVDSAKRRAITDELVKRYRVTGKRYPQYHDDVIDIGMRCDRIGTSSITFSFQFGYASSWSRNSW